MRLFGALVDLVLPWRCAACGVRLGPPGPSGPLCSGCLGPLTARPRPCPPRPAPGGLPAPWAVAGYEGSVRTAIVAYKERGRAALARPLGAALARAIRTVAGGDTAPGGRRSPVELVAVPSGRTAVRRRGRDVNLDLLVAAIAELRRQGIPAVALPALTHLRQVSDQAALGARERRDNLCGAFGVVPRWRTGRLAGRRLVVVDDVITTGATLAEAARALRAAGAIVPSAVVVAATRRHGCRTGSARSVRAASVTDDGRAPGES